MIFANRFAGKRLVVTGAAQGIGRAVALRAAAEGGDVLFVDRADFVNDVATEAGTRGHGFVCDLETYDGASVAMAEAVGGTHFRQTGYDHQNSYNDDKVLASLLYSIVKIANTATWWDK